MLCHLLTKLELTASASMAQRLTDDCVCQRVKDVKTSGSNIWEGVCVCVCVCVFFLFLMVGTVTVYH